MGYASGDVARKGLREALASGGSEADVRRGLIAVFACDQDLDESLDEWAAANEIEVPGRRVA